jgi:hypothetical protein
MLYLGCRVSQLKIYPSLIDGVVSPIIGCSCAGLWTDRVGLPVMTRRSAHVESGTLRWAQTSEWAVSSELWELQIADRPVTLYTVRKMSVERFDNRTDLSPSLLDLYETGVVSTLAFD